MVLKVTTGISTKKHATLSRGLGTERGRGEMGVRLGWSDMECNVVRRDGVKWSVAT